MVEVKISLLPRGQRNREQRLQDLLIWNVGGADTGKYDAVLSHSSTFRGQGFRGMTAPMESDIWRRARNIEHRRSDSPAHLVWRALEKLCSSTHYAGIGRTGATPLVTAPEVSADDDRLLFVFAEGWRAAGRSLETPQDQADFVLAYTMLVGG
jgi:hypothetical protein